MLRRNVRIEIGPFIYRSKLLYGVLTVAFFVGFARLGVWQLDRAEQKQVLAQTIQARTIMPPIEPHELLAPDSEYRHRRIVLRGTFEPDKQVFLEGKKHAGHVGFHVVTPLRVSGTNQWILVNRGWIAAGKDGSVQVDVSAPQAEVAVHGVVDIPAIPILVLKGSTRGLQARRLPYLDLYEYSRWAGIVVQPFVVLQDADDPHGYVRAWPSFDARQWMHIGYAIQWFAFAIIVIVIHLVTSISRKR